MKKQAKPPIVLNDRFGKPLVKGARVHIIYARTVSNSYLRIAIITRCTAASVFFYFEDDPLKVERWTITTKVGVLS